MLLVMGQGIMYRQWIFFAVLSGCFADLGGLKRVPPGVHFCWCSTKNSLPEAAVLNTPGSIANRF